MKEFLFQHAAHTIHVSHQDLVAMDVAGMTHGNHWTCEALAAALQRAPNLRVYVVVTGPYGSGRLDSYFNVTNGPQSAADYIMYYSRGTAQRANVSLWKRLTVAPLRFTHVPRGANLFWPGADDLAVGCEGGLAQTHTPKAVGNHCKLTLIDNDVFVVGSDNHYPHNLAEINLVMDGPIVAQVITQYWDHLMLYSTPAAVPQWNSVLPTTGA
jgi:hypothetical protein